MEERYVARKVASSYVRDVRINSDAVKWLTCGLCLISTGLSSMVVRDRIDVRVADGGRVPISAVLLRVMQCFLAMYTAASHTSTTYTHEQSVFTGGQPDTEALRVCRLWPIHTNRGFGFWSLRISAAVRAGVERTVLQAKEGSIIERTCVACFLQECI